MRASHNRVGRSYFKSSILVPARDILTLDPLWRAIFGDEAWNADGAGVADSSFFTNRSAADLTPERVARGACGESPPQPPFAIQKVKTRGATAGFIGTDAGGRTFLFKLDHPDYPELGTSTAIIGSRILWALGYNVPPVHLVQIEGTGDRRFAGQRATATLFLDNVRGHFNFDWFRYRREMRGLRLASAWINDVDRVGTNTLVVVADGHATLHLIDFNSCLGSWQGLPKEPWRGWRHQGQFWWWLAQIGTFGLARPEPDPHQPVISPAVGRFTAEHFDPLRWRSQWYNSAFERMSPADARWMAAKISTLGRAHIQAIVAAANLSNPADAEYLVNALLDRQQTILNLLAD